MSQQTEFVFRLDGFWYAPPMDPSDREQFTLSFTDLMPGDPINAVLSVTATYATLETNTVTNDASSVSLWLHTGILGKTAVVKVKVRGVSGRELERSFKVEVRNL